VLWQNRGDNTFDEVGNVLGLASRLDSRGAATADLDNDGDLDLVVYNRNMPLVRIFRNDAPPEGASLLVDLVSPGGNAIGAQATLRCGEDSMLRQVEAGSGFMSQSASTLHFGLGGCARVDEIAVRWPSGREDRWRDLEVGQRVTLSEGAPVPAALAPVRARNHNEAEVLAVAGGLSASVPALRLARFDAEGELELGELGTGVSVLNFWATWCVPCRTEMPELVSLSRAYGPRGVRFYGVTMDEAASAAAVRDFLAEYGVAYEQLWGSAEAQAPFASLASAPNGSVPMTAVIADGLVRRVTAGPIDRAALAALLDALGREAKTAVDTG